MFRAKLIQRLQAAFNTAGITLPDGLDVNLSLASDTRFGDYQSNTAMVLGKQLRPIRVPLQSRFAEQCRRMIFAVRSAWRVPVS